MMLPAVLFPDPDRPRSTRRSSGVDEADETVGKEEAKEEEAEVVVVVGKVGVEGEEEKTRDWEDEVRDTADGPPSRPLNR